MFQHFTTRTEKSIETIILVYSLNCRVLTQPPSQVKGESKLRPYGCEPSEALTE